MAVLVFKLQLPSCQFAKRAFVNRLLFEVTLSLRLLSLPIPSLSRIHKVRKILKSHYEMLKLSI
jgi:hypothetical protein